MNRHALWCPLLVGLMATVAGAAWAQDQQSATPSAESIIEQLKVKGGDNAVTGRTRSLELGAASQAVEAAKQPAPPASISVQINFDFNSDRINGASAQTMGNLAQALASKELQGRNFRIVGHTDGVGSPGYNLALSKRRAVAVRTYLVDHGVEAGRLSATGVGMDDLLNKNDPSAGENRRVVIEASGG